MKREDLPRGSLGSCHARFALLLLVLHGTGGRAQDEDATRPTKAGCRLCAAVGRMECRACRGMGFLSQGCTSCRGNGKAECPLCGESFRAYLRATAPRQKQPGRGRVACQSPYCQGGKAVNGKKVLPCKLCGGDDEIVCPLCRNDAIRCGCQKTAVRLACPECAGRGDLPCPLCARRPQGTECSICNGVVAGSCGGCARFQDTWSICMTCAGRGTMVCETCAGGGKRPCESCRATGVSVTGPFGQEERKCRDCQGRGFADCANCPNDAPGKVACRNCAKGRAAGRCGACRPDRPTCPGCAGGRDQGAAVLARLLADYGEYELALDYWKHAIRFGKKAVEEIREELRKLIETMPTLDTTKPESLRDFAREVNRLNGELARATERNWSHAMCAAHLESCIGSSADEDP